MASDPIEQLTTPAGTAWLVRSTVGNDQSPRPTLLLLAMDGHATLSTDPYRHVGERMRQVGWHLVSLDLPCHGSEQRQGEPAQIQGWAHRAAQGENFVEAFCARASAVLDHLIESGVTDPARLAVAGTSRGGFLAFHVAAHDKRIRAAAGFAPVTDLLAVSEFAQHKDNQIIRELSLINHVDRLAGKHLWAIIGASDDRVDTDSAIAFARATTRAAEAKGIEPRTTLHVVPTPGHSSHSDWHDQAADWLEQVFI